MMTPKVPAHVDELDIAIIGMAGRFPGARNLHDYWSNLSRGVESITRFSIEELKAAGTDPAVLADPAFVPASAILDDAEMFDAAFFGYSPREARLMDPQSRVFLECAWEAFESAGYDPRSCAGPVGVYASQSLNTYLLGHAIQTFNSRDFTLSAANLPTVIGNGNDFLTSRVSYKLHLNGPSINIQTACSSSLVAVHFARQAVLSGECDMALAGAVSIYVPQKTGYVLTDGMILSPDGHCRPFDAEAKGTVFGRGVGIVLLKSLARAIADGDNIRAVIKGSAINNDGVNRAGYTAPGVEGQSRVVAEALANAGVDADTIGYVEAHGTGTTQGDPIEVAALTQGFRATTARRQFCALGSVKSNIGHLDVAAGMAGLIKTVLMLERKQIVPTLHFRKPNPLLNIEESPFYVNTSLAKWSDEDGPRRAGVSAFGMGGTNAHVVLEEAPALDFEAPALERPVHVLPLSAKTPAALRDLARKYVEHFELHPEASVADTCYTAAVGRIHFECRAALALVSSRDAREKLTSLIEAAPAILSGERPQAPRVAFLFTGQGAQYAGMARTLYDSQPAFREALAACDKALAGQLPAPLLSVIFPPAGAPDRLDETVFTQPALFAIEYALAAMWRSWGVEPSAVLGHSVGEYVAACVAGVFSLEDGLKLIAARGRLMQALPSNGGMAAVIADESRVAAAIAPYGEALAIAAVNAPDSVVISGRRPALDAAIAQLEAAGVRTQRLRVSHAFHSALLDPMLDAFEEVASGVTYSAPRIDVISNVTGGQVDATTLAHPSYWRRHAREAVRFSAGVQTLAELGVRVFLEIGPDPILTALGRRTIGDEGMHWLPSLRRSNGDWSQVASTLAKLYDAGVDVDWTAFDRPYPRRRTVVPTYAFQRERFWLDAATGSDSRPPTSRRVVHPLLGRRIRSASAAGQFEIEFGEHLPLVDDHRLAGEAAGPASGLVEMMLAAGVELFGPEPKTVDGLVIAEPLSTQSIVQTVITARPDGRADCKVCSIDASADPDVTSWRVHATGIVRNSDGVPFAQTPPASGAAAKERALDWLYSVEWQELASSSTEQLDQTVSGRWVILADRGGLGDELARRLIAAGRKTLLVKAAPGEAFDADDNRVRMDPSRDDHYQSLGSMLRTPGAEPQHFVHLWSLDTPASTDRSSSSLVDAIGISAGSALKLTQQIDQDAPARVWFVTRGAQSVDADEHPGAVEQTPLWGFLQALDRERQELGCTAIDLDPSQSESAPDLWVALRSAGPENRMAIRRGRHFGLRLARVRADQEKRAIIRPDATYLITGGLGALGLATARWLAARGARSLVLVGRRTPSESAIEAIAELESIGVSVHCASGDVARVEDVDRIVGEIETTRPPLGGIVHAAGVLDDGVVERQTWSRYAAVLAPKAAGAWNLHRRTLGRPLDFFIQFSSIASVFGSAGQTSYAAANAFLDGLAHHRRALGLPATAINWGPWAGVGMAASMDVRDRERLTRSGYEAIAEDVAWPVLDLSLSGRTQIVAVKVNWPEYFKQFDRAGIPRLYRDVQSGLEQASGTRTVLDGDDFRRQIEALPAKRRRGAVLNHVRAEAVAVLGLSATQGFELERPLNELGLDSLMAIELRNRLGRAIGRTLPATLLFKAPSVDALADALLLELYPPSADVRPVPVSHAGVAQFDELSDEEVTLGLAAELEALARKGFTN